MTFIEGDEPDAAPDNGTVRTCAFEGCDNTFVPGSTGFAALRKFCDTHKTTHKNRKKSSRRPRRDRVPPNIAVNLGTPKATKDETKIVEERVLQLVSVIAGAVAMAGAMEDAQDIAAHRQTVAAAAANLSKYEPWLRQLAAGGQVADRTLAWVTMVLALLGMLVPILRRHQMLPKELEGMVAMFGGQPVAESPRDAEPEPAAA